tara:strand:+ start:16138 stop:16320 length:183 start_codon:yes stop_codon:yes gene_type:complete
LFQHPALNSFQKMNDNFTIEDYLTYPFKSNQVETNPAFQLPPKCTKSISISETQGSYHVI